MEKKILIGPTDALVITDMQRDFLYPAGRLCVKGIPGEPSGKLIENILTLGEYLFHYLFTWEDLHDPGNIEFPIHGEHSLAGNGYQLYHPSLMPLYNRANMNLVKGDNVHLFGYSAGSGSHFLQHIVVMRVGGIKRVFIVGVAYNFCVGESAIDYARQGFETFIVRDATRSIPSPPLGTVLPVTQFPSAAIMKKKLKLYGVKEVFMKDISAA